MMRLSGRMIDRKDDGKWGYKVMRNSVIRIMEILSTEYIYHRPMPDLVSSAKGGFPEDSF